MQSRSASSPPDRACAPTDSSARTHSEAMSPLADEKTESRSKATLVASLTAAIQAALAADDEETAEWLGARLARVLARPLPDGVAAIDVVRTAERARRGKDRSRRSSLCFRTCRS
jgi:hypothetical protein